MPAERRESLAASLRRSPPKPPKSSPPVQPELFRSAVVNLVDPKHPLVRLAGPASRVPAQPSREQRNGTSAAFTAPRRALKSTF
jgi:hypothetical protein